MDNCTAPHLMRIRSVCRISKRILLFSFVPNAVILVPCLIPSAKSEYNEILDIRNHILRPRKSFIIMKPLYKRTNFASSLGLSSQAREKS